MSGLSAGRGGGGLGDPGSRGPGWGVRLVKSGVAGAQGVGRSGDLM